ARRGFLAGEAPDLVPVRRSVLAEEEGGNSGIAAGGILGVLEARDEKVAVRVGDRGVADAEGVHANDGRFGGARRGNRPLQHLGGRPGGQQRDERRREAPPDDVKHGPPPKMGSIFIGGLAGGLSPRLESVRRRGPTSCQKTTRRPTEALRPGCV